jgi:hypothetical protein
MGLLIKLQDGDTQLKSLKFGKDRPGGGDSGQPFIKTSIPVNSENPQAFNDFILRGGIKAPLDAAEDTARLSKYFFDFKSPSGLLFIAKQNLLSKTGTKTEASKGFLNEGIYTPLSTLAQAGLGFLGAHFNKQGLDPLTGVKTYQEAIQQNQFKGTEFNPNNNRLLALTNAVTNNQGVPNFSSIKNYTLNINESTLISYPGGSDSNIGIGSTNIKFATDSFGVAVKTLTNQSGSYIRPYKNEAEKWKLPFGATTDYNKLFPQAIPTTSSEASPIYVTDGIDSYQYNLSDPYKTQITQFGDKDQLIIDEYTSSISTILISKGYKPEQIEELKGIPGGNNIQVTNRTSSITPSDSIDKIPKSRTREQIYDSRTAAGNKAYNKGAYTIDNNSLIPFKITVVDPRFPQNESNITFKAYIDTLSDSYGADWASQVYMGRGEKFYKYNTFSRDINLGFTVAAENKTELDEMYVKLNILAASLAPTYTSAGYMAGNLHRLTIGNYVVGQYGIMTSLTYDIMEESPWEIEPGVQLPHYIRVSGVKFTPIHNWRPESQFNVNFQPTSTQSTSSFHSYINQGINTN